jgi:hypothetical protein
MSERVQKTSDILRSQNNCPEQASPALKNKCNPNFASYNFFQRTIPDTKAKTEIVSYLVKRKIQGITTVNILDLVSDLNLPAQQIDRIMENLEGSKL